MPRFVTIGYGDSAGYARTPPEIRDAAHAHDQELKRRGALMGIAGPPVQVRNSEATGAEIENGPFMTSQLPVAGFTVIEAADLAEAVRLAANSPCAVANGVVEVWPLIDADPNCPNDSIDEARPLMNIAAPAKLFRPPAAKRNAKPLSAVGILMGLARNPVEIWSDFHFKQPILIGKTYFGYRAVVSDPAAIRRVFLDNVANYRKDAVQLRVLRPGLGNGLLTVDGEAWKVQRRSIAPLFSPRQVAAFAPAMHRVARARAEAIAARHDGAVVEAQEEMALVALKVLEQTLFSQGLARDASDFQKAVTRYFDTIGRIDPLDVLGAPDFLPRIGKLRGKESLAFFASAVNDIIAARRALIASGATPPEDLLTLLLRAADPETGRGMSEEDVRANIVTFIGAGHETTANALTWTLYLLSQSPEWRARVEAEIDAAFDPDDETDPTDRLPTTRAVFEEAMRLYPPAANLVREAIAEDWLGGHRVPAGTVVSVSPYIVHRHETLWDHPDDFDPSRFLPGRREKIDRYAYIPFGAGPRVCIGQAFAIQEGLIVLAHLLKRVRLDLFPGHPVALQQRITLRPRDGMRMIARRR